MSQVLVPDLGDFKDVEVIDVLVKPGDDCHGVRRSLQAMVGERFGIEHVTLQVDHAPAGDRLLEIEPRR